MTENSNQLTRRALQLDDGTISYLSAGDAGQPKLFFAHATGFNAETYLTLLKPLTEYFQVRAWDARGHGFTDLPAEAATKMDWLDYTNDLLAFLRSWSGPKPILVGHSMGGTVSILAAATDPQICAGVLALDPPIIPAALRGPRLDLPLARAAARRRAKFADQQAIFDAYKGKGAFASWPDAFLRDYINGGTRPTGSGEIELTCMPDWEAATFSRQNHDTWAALSSIQVPCLILTAPNQSPTRINEPLANPNIDLQTMAQGSHFFPMEFAQSVEKTIRQFANRAAGQ